MHLETTGLFNNKKLIDIIKIYKSRGGINMKTSVKIAKARSKINLTQDQLAELLDVSRQTISKWELDISLPDTSKLVKLSKVLNVSIDYLLNEEENNTKIKASITQSDSGYEIDWTQVCPILTQYEKEVNCEHYSKIFNTMLDEVEKTYKYSSEDSIVVLKDLLYKAYLSKNA